MKMIIVETNSIGCRVYVILYDITAQNTTQNHLVVPGCVHGGGAHPLPGSGGRRAVLRMGVRERRPAGPAGADGRRGGGQTGAQVLCVDALGRGGTQTRDTARTLAHSRTPPHTLSPSLSCSLSLPPSFPASLPPCLRPCLPASLPPSFSLSMLLSVSLSFCPSVCQLDSPALPTPSLNWRTLTDTHTCTHAHTRDTRRLSRPTMLSLRLPGGITRSSLSPTVRVCRTWHA